MVCEARDQLFITAEVVPVLILGWSDADSGVGARLLGAEPSPSSQILPELLPCPKPAWVRPPGVCVLGPETLRVIRIFPRVMAVGGVGG